MLAAVSRYPTKPPDAGIYSSSHTLASLLGLSNRNGAQIHSCTFHGQLVHHIYGYPTAEYDRVKIIDNRLHLPMGQPIPNDGCGLDLQVSVDACKRQQAVTPAKLRHRPSAPLGRSQFRGHSEPASSTGAYVIEAEANSDTDCDDDGYTTVPSSYTGCLKKSLRPRRVRGSQWHWLRRVGMGS
ncbi:hypothetical protein BJY52DRAFT_1313954 [Lactarius psammicola]|nr:hypothetical protein BJY52DRAFT_1313954 [Lactarius psammicola]